MWDKKFLLLAKHVSEWSKDPSTKIGVVAVSKNHNILSLGYNGFPRGIEDSHERLHVREVKYNLVVHGEKNCIYNACLNGVSLNESIFYIYGLPVCHECAKALIQIGTTSVLSWMEKDLPASWADSMSITKVLFKEAGIKYRHIDGIVDTGYGIF